MHPCPAAGGSTRETRNSTLTHRSAIETYFFESEERPHLREVNAVLWGQRGRFRTPGGGGRRLNLIHNVKYRAGGLVHRQLEHSKNISIKSQAGVADTRLSGFRIAPNGGAVGPARSCTSSAGWRTAEWVSTLTRHRSLLVQGVCSVAYSQRESMLTLDAEATNWINALSGRGQLLDLLMIAVTYAGVPFLVLAVAAQWWLGSGLRSERHVVAACGLSFLLGLALNQAILLFVHRMRPYDAGITHLLIAPSADPSFPSDHATATFSIVFGYLFNMRFRKALCFFAGALLIVFSRVYLGTHYVSDILGGISTAFVAAGLVRVAYREGTRLDRWVTGIL